MTSTYICCKKGLLGQHRKKLLDHCEEVGFLLIAFIVCVLFLSF